MSFHFYVNSSYNWQSPEPVRAATGQEVNKKGPQKVSTSVQTSLIRNMLASFFALAPAPALQLRRCQSRDLLLICTTACNIVDSNLRLKQAEDDKKGVSSKNVYLRLA